MTTGHDIVAEARTWKGTPFHHQAALKGIGCDCYGLIRGVASELGLIPDHKPITNYPAVPDGSMERIMREVLVAVPKTQAQPGDIVAFAWARDVQHMGFLTERNTVIHGYGRGNKGKVVETPFTGYHLERSRGVFRFPEVTHG